MGTQTMAPHANSIGSCCALMKRGTLVLYNADNDPLWASGTAGEHGAHCILQGDGHFCIYALDPDGNVSKDSEDCIWRSRVCGFDDAHGCYCVMQNDGNFVQYTRDGEPLWSTATEGGNRSNGEGEIRVSDLGNDYSF